MIKWVKKMFWYWNNLEKCPKCKCRETIDTNFDYINDSVIGEYDITCEKCGTVINHFAYGSWEYQDNKIDEIKEIWDRYWACTFWQKLRWTIQTIFG